MKIYFAGSIRGGRDDALIYSQIISLLKNFGDVLTEHIADNSLSPRGEKINEKYIHDRDMDWLLTSDILIAEVTNPSLGVGYEVGRAIEHGKKVICLYRTIKDKKVSAMILGSNKIISINYSTLIDLEKLITKHLLIP